MSIALSVLPSTLYYYIYTQDVYMTIRFKQSLITTAAFTALTVSSASFAHNHGSHDADSTNYKKWIGGFGEYYHPDGDKPDEIGGGFLEDGAAIGGEFGIRFTPRWALRLSAAKNSVDAAQNQNMRGSVDGTNFGVDALYFQDDLQTYLFTGLHHVNDDFDDYLSAAFGVGKHWNLNENWRVITEATGYHTFSDHYNDYSLKLGLAYVWGEVTESYAPSRATPVQMTDSDRDGISDAIDNCPNTSRGDSVDSRGCSVDSDRDGIVNSVDLCPSTPQGDTVDNTGCSVMLQKEIELQLMALFANNSSVIQNPEDVKFAEFADFLTRYNNAEGTIEGHTSIVGSDAYNQMLSQKRADAVKALLVSRYGAPADRITAVGYGESRPVNSANNAAAHSENRRIIGIVKATVESK